MYMYSYELESMLWLVGRGHRKGSWGSSQGFTVPFGLIGGGSGFESRVDSRKEAKEGLLQRELMFLKRGLKF